VLLVAGDLFVCCSKRALGACLDDVGNVALHYD
jgi:hypothetical protein